MISVSVQKCHNAPICELFAKPANFIFKFLSLKISLIQADCHRKQVLVGRSTRFHSLEQSLEILPERDSDLLTSLDKRYCTLPISMHPEHYRRTTSPCAVWSGDVSLVPHSYPKVVIMPLNASCDGSCCFSFKG